MTMNIQTYNLPEGYEQTNDKCLNGCGMTIIKTTEADGPDDYRFVWICTNCKERWE